MTRYTFPRLVFSFRTPQKSARKAGLKICGQLLLWVFETHLQGGAELSVIIIQALFKLVFISVYTSCFYNLMVCSRGQCGKTNNYTYIHTHTLFRKQSQETWHAPTSSHWLALDVHLV